MIGQAVRNLQAAVDQLVIAVDGDEIAAVLRAQQLITAKLLQPLAEYDAAELYHLSQHACTRQALQHQAGLSRRDAADTVRRARKLAALPGTRAALLDGTLSVGHVDAIVANLPRRLLERWRDAEPALVPMLSPLTPEQAAVAVARWAACVDDGPERAAPPSWLFHAKTLDGRYDTRGEFDPEAGAIIDVAVTAAMGDSGKSGSEARPPAHRRADALVEICEFFLRHTKTAEPALPKRTPFQLCAVITTDDLRNATGATLVDGTPLDGPTFDRWRCDSELQRLLTDPDGAIKRYELMPATVNDALYRALAIRDRGCRWPGCDKPAYLTQIHHLKHPNGPTGPEWCCLLCRYHHKYGAHRPGTQLHLAPDATLTITHPDGTTRTTRPPPPWPNAQN